MVCDCGDYACSVLVFQVVMGPYFYISELFQDGICGDYVAELLDFLDYSLMIDQLVPPRLRRQHARFVDVDTHVVGTGVRDDPYDLTGDDADLLPVATRLDFTIICDELDNNGLFGARS